MTNRILRFLSALFILIFSLFSLALAQNDRDAYQTDRFQTSYSPVVEIRTSGGGITVIGHDEDYVEVQMFVQRRGSYLSSGEADLSDYEIIIKQDGDKITAHAQRDSGLMNMIRQDRSYSISFKVSAPNASTVDGRTSGGSVHAENIHNSIDLRTSGGSVRAEQLSGNADLRTSGGSIRLNNIDGELSARTSGGNIRAEYITGTANLQTSGGSIRLENIEAKLSARTSGGSISAEFLEFRDDIELRTSGGSIDIRIPNVAHFDLNLAGRNVNTDLNNFSGSSSRNSISGKVGNGGPMLSARTSGGSVNVRYHQN